MIRANQIYFLLLLINFTSLYSFSKKSCAIACVAKDIAELRLDDYECLQLYENYDNIIVFFENNEHIKDYNGVNFYALADFQSVVKNYDYILIVKPDFFNDGLFKRYDGMFFLCSDVFNIIHIGLDDNLAFASSLDGNIYFPHLKKIALVNSLEQLQALTYQTVYDVVSLGKHLLGKGTPNIYLLEVILQTCLFYNRIKINEKNKIFRFPFLSAYC